MTSSGPRDRATEAGKEALDRLQQPGQEQFDSEQDYVDRYTATDENGKHIDPDSIAWTGLNRLLYGLDQLGKGSGSGKPVYVHLLTALFEIWLAEQTDSEQ